ncbi:MAG TPA: hypothetical protein VLD67_16215 [Vicinamibacterales bacterium]|nr:hypothetical protein [Vicinamibacterales bacterium]
MNDPRPVPQADAGLCSRCRHHRIVSSARGATFVLCRLSETDPRFARYPRLPVLTCSGFRAASPDPDSGSNHS